MKSWDALPEHRLSGDDVVTRAFLDAGVAEYRATARHIHRLPYGRNSSRTDPLIVLREGHGTCSTKHALLARLAIEQGLDIELALGIYQMTEANTPGVGPVLAAAGLVYIPEAHCYLRYREERIDVTRDSEHKAAEPIVSFMHEETINPDQIGEYKIAMHQRWLREWMASPDAPRGVGFAELWRIRENCIAALKQ